jgi:hypothetical protein
MRKKIAKVGGKTRNKLRDKSRKRRKTKTRKST